MKYLFILLIIPMVSHADVFKCNVGGKLTFSDIPCAPDAEKIHIKETNQSNGYINDLYSNEMKFGAGNNQLIKRINSVIRITAAKGKDCKNDLTTSDSMSSCFDYMNHVMAGGAYKNAYNNFLQLTQNQDQKNLAAFKSEIAEINNNVKLVTEYTSMLRSYLNNL